ncbi:RNA polymerase subunit sigma [Sporosarcina ureilytica]|uniref:RNA polymerase subunit sigma n=1 Tax=Sporosarcina ureilytica TaxID=298596 RepID=A0A1D8JKH9_9BACL|nr:RNA polymerase subunit sigma [Sporosarcina ureilytica]
MSPDEEERYASFTKDLNLEHLKGLKPKSVAKMYVQAILDKKYEVQYALYTDREEAVQWSKEEDQSIPESDRGTIEQNRKLFNNIGKGEFIQISDYEGYIEYDSGEGISGFQMIKNDDGIWQVAFMPIQ